MKFDHGLIEKNVTLLIVLVILTISVGGLVEIVPLFFQRSTTEPVAGLKPYDALQLAGRDVYVREGCYGCHSQMIRPFRAETERYGHYSVAGEFVYDRPFQWGSKRTGPDLARVGGRYNDEWHRIHLMNPRDLVPESNMPGYPWLAKAMVSGETMRRICATTMQTSSSSFVKFATSWLLGCFDKCGFEIGRPTERKEHEFGGLVQLEGELMWKL